MWRFHWKALGNKNLTIVEFLREQNNMLRRRNDMIGEVGKRKR